MHDAELETEGLCRGPLLLKATNAGKLAEVHAQDPLFGGNAVLLGARCEWDALPTALPLR